jgi:hypothetical protein
VTEEVVAEAHAELGRHEKLAVGRRQGDEKRIARRFAFLPAHRRRHVDAAGLQRLEPAGMAPEDRLRNPPFAQ